MKLKTHPGRYVIIIIIVVEFFFLVFSLGHEPFSRKVSLHKNPQYCWGYTSGYSDVSGNGLGAGMKDRYLFTSNRASPGDGSGNKTNADPHFGERFGFLLSQVKGEVLMPTEENSLTEGDKKKMIPYLVSWAFSSFLDHRHAESSVTCKDCHRTFLPVNEITVEQCQECHGSYKRIAGSTEGVFPNPHKSHLGEIRCFLCHKAHEKSRFYCNECHILDVKVP